MRLRSSCSRCSRYNYWWWWWWWRWRSNSSVSEWWRHHWSLLCTFVRQRNLLAGHTSRTRCCCAMPNSHPRTTAQSRSATLATYTVSQKKCPLLKRDFLINCWDLTALSAPIGDIVPYKENLFPDKIKHRPNKLGIRKRLKSLHPAASRRTCFSQSLIRFSNWIISHFSRHRWYV